MKKVKVVILELLLAMYLIIAILFPPFKYSYSKEGYEYTARFSLSPNSREREPAKYYEFKRYEYLFSNPQTVFREDKYLAKYYKRNLLYSELAIECLLGIMVYGLSLLIKNKLINSEKEQTLNKT